LSVEKKTGGINIGESKKKRKAQRFKKKTKKIKKKKKKRRKNKKIKKKKIIGGERSDKGIVDAIRGGAQKFSVLKKEKGWGGTPWEETRTGTRTIKPSALKEKKRHNNPPVRGERGGLKNRKNR